MKVAQSNRQQCYFPLGSNILINNNGTADGFFIKAEHGIEILALPGPPRELKPLWTNALKHLKNQANSSHPNLRHTFRTIGLGESTIADRLADTSVPDHFNIGYRAHVPFVDLKINFPSDLDSLDQAKVLIKKYRQLLGSHIFYEGDKPMTLREDLNLSLIHI